MPITLESQNALRNILLPHLKDLSTKRGVFFITEEKGGGLCLMALGMDFFWRILS